MSVPHIPLHVLDRIIYQRPFSSARHAKVRSTRILPPFLPLPRFAEFLFFCFAVTRKVFIAEITARAFIVADSNKRRTLSRADITKALSKSDQFDFLIDIVPRDEPFVPGVSGPGKNAKKAVPGAVSVRVRVMLPWLPGMSFDEFDSLHPHRRQPHKKHRVTHRGTPLSMAEIVLTWMACPTPAC